MPIKQGLKKILVIGSGPIIIGQAAEFDYAGTQACRAIKDEGIGGGAAQQQPGYHYDRYPYC